MSGASRAQAADAFFDLCEGRGWSAAMGVLRTFLEPQVVAMIEAVPPERRREFVMVCADRLANPVDVENRVYSVEKVSDLHSIVMMDGRAISIPITHAEAERVATRAAWG